MALGTNMEDIESSEYDAESLGNARLRAGEPEQQHPEFGLETVPLQYGKPLADFEDRSTAVEIDEDEGVGWEDTRRRLVRRNGEFVSDVSSRFKLVPNEKVVAAANNAAKRLGAVPFNEYGDSDDDWYIRLDKHVFQDPARHRVHALYAWEDPVDITGDGDTVQFGFAVHNSIDGSQSFEVGLFSFRHACANMVTMGIGGQGQDFDQREVYAHTKRSHTKSLDVDVDELQAIIEEVITFADDVKEGYREFRETIISEEQIIDLIDRLPAKDLPDWIDASNRKKDERDGRSVAELLDAARERRIEDMKEEADSDIEIGPSDIELTPDEKQSIAAEAMAEHEKGDETMWETYNSVTEAVWHSDSTSDQTKDRKFKQLHRVMPPAEGIR
jgi:hypothetical protein